jgi:hypothetical protein
MKMKIGKFSLLDILVLPVAGVVGVVWQYNTSTTVFGVLCLYRVLFGDYTRITN